MKREVWIDYIKVLACVLVVLGHFFQSMVKAVILPDNNLYQWFNTMIYYFHVPLFFICSGYLYQKYKRVDSWSSWGRNIKQKALVLGVPYFVFSFATWLLKTVFVGNVNDEIGGLGSTLFLSPTSPYWYLYILFFIFLITPTMKDRTGMWILAGISFILKLLRTIGGGIAIWNVYAIQGICANEIWFVLGMMLTRVKLEKCRMYRTVGAIAGALFIVASIWIYSMDNGMIAFGMGLLACAAVVLLMIGCKEVRVVSSFAKYTMPIFLMHTLFAAPLRTVLMKVGVTNSIVHVVLGIAISFVGPIVAIKVMEMLKIDFLVYPKRLAKKGNVSGVGN